MNRLNAVLPFLLYLALGTSIVRAEITERRTFIPVQVAIQTGEVIKRDMELVIFEDDAVKARRPVVVFGHGYPGHQTSLATWMWLLTHRKGLHELVKLGFNVVMPMRIGQGGTGGLTLEHGCNSTSECYGNRIKNINTQLIQAAGWVKQQDFAKADELLYVGQSAGGSAAIGLSADLDNPFKVLINFAAGSGKDRLSDFPCSPEAYSEQLEVYGRKSKTGMLWIYGANDSYWGKKWPVKWAEAYRNGGGKFEFHQIESNTSDGHNLFRNSPEVWVPIVKDYLVRKY